ncbi:alpha/beta hydrolase [Roseivirga pacifica]|uniref:alpha/beta hydrolase n=1 Tax=Roseivirga pacifica TaxID=1267423 RepID=UPI00227A0BBC|nr:alpha/beta hydrolase [Roseivirga pacifica]
MSQEKIRFKNSNNGIEMSAYLDLPENFDKSQKYPAIVVTHPGGGVKEQTAGIYGRKFSEHGFVAIVTDASYQGESGGEPRQLENPYIRTEDISAVIDHLTTLPFVDNERIGAFGICAGGGYTVNAAINDKRIKAVGTVSAVNIGHMISKGWLGDQDMKDAVGSLQFGAQARTQEANGSDIVQMPMAPMREEDTPYTDLKEAWEYYHTDRAQCSTSPGYGTARSLTQLVTYDAFNMAEIFLTQPLKVIAGSVAESKWMSDDLMERAASEDKSMYIVEGANHMKLYDIPKYVDEAVSQAAPFFQKNVAELEPVEA